MIVRSNMPFFQVKNTNYMVKIICILFAVFMIAGCVAQDAQSPKTEEPQHTKTDEVEKRAEIISGRQINAIFMKQTDQAIEIDIQGNQKLSWSSIKQDFPFGIAVYFTDTKISNDFETPPSEYKSIGDFIVTYADKEETIVKVEILLTQDLNYEVKEVDNTLKVSLSSAPDQNMEMANKSVETLSSASVENMSKTEAVSENSMIVPKKTATMTNIEFNTMEDGKSDIVVQTNHPVKYDIAQGKDGKLYLNLYNTVIPYYHQRALLTHYFKSAVESLMPLQLPGKKKNAKIEIQTRDNVPYRIVQDQNIISIFFEPSRIEPPVFAKSKKQVISGEQTQMAKVPAQETQPLQMKPNKRVDEKKTAEEQMFGAKKEYTGEKIKLDFYETDIKNVIRILRSVGGLNFAIDKDVSGKVTLSLEEPVPWDQVLDLVLKMNNLGQKKEGNVIRIATLSTISKEEKSFQDMIAAKKKSLQQQESIEPLVTEYIPINYSDAETDIKPHISQMLTDDRGRISVDQRTNMVIITDIQSKVDQAKEIIYRLDKVTPQIMIEAKVVEVTKDFSRELGLGLGFTKSQTAPTGRERDFNVALNSPLAAPVNTGSFNFYRILGSNFLSLNAQIAASETKGDIKIVSSPRILTLDNKKAKIKQGLEVAYEEKAEGGGTSVKFKSIDLLLEVTPHVTPDSRISMTIFLTKNDIGDIISGIPSLSTNEAETELLVNDRDTIIIGGIVKTTQTDSSTGTPFLSGIPILGRLFRTDLNKDKRNELLIFITPSIVQLEQKRNKFIKPSN